MGKLAADSSCETDSIMRQHSTALHQECSIEDVTFENVTFNKPS